MPAYVYFLAKQRLQCLAVALHDETICFGDAFQRAVDGEDERVIQTARSLEHGSAARTATQHRHAAFLTSLQIDFERGFVGIPKNNEIFDRFPKTEHAVAVTCFTAIQQC